MRSFQTGDDIHVGCVANPQSNVTSAIVNRGSRNSRLARFDSSPHEVLVGREPRIGFELPGEVKSTHLCYTRKRDERELFVQIVFDIVNHLSEPPLPNRSSLPRRRDSGCAAAFAQVRQHGYGNRFSF